MKNLTPIANNTARSLNGGGGPLWFAVKLFFKIVFTPTEVY